MGEVVRGARVPPPLDGSLPGKWPPRPRRRPSLSGSSPGERPHHPRRCLSSCAGARRGSVCCVCGRLVPVVEWGRKRVPLDREDWVGQRTWGVTNSGSTVRTQGSGHGQTQHPEGILSIKLNGGRVVTSPNQIGFAILSSPSNAFTLKHSYDTRIKEQSLHSSHIYSFVRIR